MPNIKFNTPGCFIGILVLIFLMFIFKFLFLILPIIILFILYKKFSKIINKNGMTNPEFVSRPGKIYKECIYCGKKAERKEIACNSCGKRFEQA
jgi:uncharacterized membrane protein